ncbi:ElyC/SanA/YdcF family protein [Thalassotalea euphylliae]|uniref:ElyC/SanA/YdcF family protein n=1 Tax=Thalassotalea euphylliae TaxID=1655234 RepID=UPI0036D90453
MTLSSISPVADNLMHPIENSYETFSRSSTPVNYIIVLGCGHTTNYEMPALTQLKDCSLRRLIEGVRISKLHPEAKIITSGFAFHDEVTNAVKVKQAAIELGVPRSKIITEPFPKDTREEAQLIAPRVIGQNVVLVTDASHMPRAMKYFELEGVKAIPAPTGFRIKNINEPLHWSHFVPVTGNLEKTSNAWYESMGRLWQWLAY